MTKGKIEKTASINIGEYSNLQITYTDIKDINKEELLKELLEWNNILVTYVEKRGVSVPAGVKLVKKCKECGGSNLVFSTGVSRATGKQWYAFDCQDCKTESNDGKEYPTRTFTTMTETEVAKEEPKPTKATLSPFLRAPVVAPMKESRALFASALVNFASAAIASINSALFILLGF